jgi:outer membrane receptor protein involved in Fe transport
MQAVSDLFLGWADGISGSNRQFYGRQLHDMKGGFDIDAAKLATIELYADLCARTLAQAHARSGDTVAIAAYLGEDKAFADAVEVFAVAESHFIAGDHTRLTEAIAAAYVSGEAKLSSTWSVQAGLRYEHTANEGRDEGGAVVTERRYGSWFPSFYLGYAPSDQRAWTFRYSRRVDRPAMNDLNPFRWYINPANYVEGNPLLQPAFINNLELSFSNNNNLSAAVYHSLTSSASTYATIFTDGGATSYVMTLNALDQQQYGIQANYAFTALKNLQTEASASLFRSEARTLVPEQVPSVEGNGALSTLTV